MDPLNRVITACIQVAIFSAIPVIYFAATRRSLRGLPEYLGLTRPAGRTVLLALVLALPNIGVAASESVMSLLVQDGTVSGQFVGHPLSLGIAVVILSEALIKTSLSEEIFFRGFVAKRAIQRFGFQRGNLLQAVIFGAVHSPIYFLIPETSQTWDVMVFLVIFPTLAGWFFGFLNEKLGNGSILPSWIMHGCGNVIAYSMPLLS
jgi:membrane protease YdiL (CAAX protease family)